MITLISSIFIFGITFLIARFNILNRHSNNQVSYLIDANILDDRQGKYKIKMMGMPLFLTEVLLIVGTSIGIQYLFNLEGTIEYVFFVNLLLFNLVTFFYYDNPAEEQTQTLLRISNKVSTNVQSVNSFKLDAYATYRNYSNYSNESETKNVHSNFIHLMETYYTYTEKCKENKLSVEAQNINGVFLKHIVFLQTILTIITTDSLREALETDLGKEERMRLISKLNVIHNDLKQEIEGVVEKTVESNTLSSLSTISSMYNLAESIK